jgi:hypothetical protein
LHDCEELFLSDVVAESVLVEGSGVEGDGSTFGLLQHSANRGTRSSGERTVELGRVGEVQAVHIEQR